MRIYNNISALTAYRSMTRTDGAITKSMEKLSTGLRINSAADDAAGLVISEQMRNQIRGFSQAIKNSQQGMSMLKTAEGAMGQQGELMGRIRELVLSANNSSMSSDNLTTVQGEIDDLVAQIDTIAANTEYNGIKILGADAGAGTFQIGANSSQALDVTFADMTTSGGLSGLTGLSVTAGFDFTAALSAVDTAISTVNEERALMGSSINRFEANISSLQVARENLQASESLIRDVDMAEEMVSLTRNQVLSQAGTAMLAQANQKPQNILQLLR